ncbi:MAG TPA: gamma-glutamyltransferase [Nocardioidaceae bacterium]|nr:gamma-glutamyltransferase [Nocardioidaceae bacterium]
MFTTRPTLQGTFGMVSSTHWLATSSAMAVLEDGGNAFDAAVVAGFVLHVVEPHQCGPGGEVPILFATADGEPTLVCGQGPAPAGATIDHYTDLGLDLVPGSGPLAAAVPGAFDAWMLLLRDHGTKSVREVLSYAIGYAERGHPAVHQLTHTIERMRETFRTEWTTSGALYLFGGQAPVGGALLRNPALAATWQRIVDEAEATGSDRETQIEAARRSWSQGFVAEALAEAAAQATRDSSGDRHPGTLTADDIAGWSATYERPVSHEWNGWTVCKAGPWSQGPVFLQQLALLPSELPEDGPDYIHLLVEGAKLAFADREAWYGDAADDVPLETLLSEPYNKDRRRRIGAQASWELRPGAPDGREPRLPRLGRRGAGLGGDPNSDTCQVAVVDRWGNLVAATPSGGWLQSNPVVESLGFPLGSRLQMTWLDPGLPSSLTPGRRPRTTLSPSLALRDGVPVMAFGTPGGDNQDQWGFHFFLDVARREPVRSGPDLQGAIDAPAWHTAAFPSSFYPRQVEPASLVVEARHGDDVVTALRAREHDVTVDGSWSQGELCAVHRDPESGVLSAAANPRGMQGYAVGR